MIQGRQGSGPELHGLALALGVLAWAAGILLDFLLLFPAAALLVGAALALLGAILFWSNGHSRLIALLAFCLLLGAWRYALASPVGDPTAISAFTNTKKLDMMGSVTADPKLQTRSSLLVVSVSSVSRDNGVTWQTAHGLVDVQITGNILDNPYGPHYGDDVELLGNLQPPFPNSSPAIFASMSFPRISISQSGGNPLIAALYNLRIYLATIITRLLPQPMAALLSALVLSLRTPSLKSFIPLFNATGTAHLIAPSGFKVTILAGLVADGSRRLQSERKKQFEPLLPAEQGRRNRRQMATTALVISTIVGYTFLSGGSPAALRAGIMGIILALAPRFGRVYNVYNALALAALLMSAFDPFVLWDAGFLLSFFGTQGIIFYTPFWMRLFPRLKHIPVGYYFVEIMMVTLAAEITTLPIFALTFHQVSIIALITNSLTMPLLPALIGLGLFVCAAGSIWLPAGIVCGWFIWPLLWYVIHVVSWCAGLSVASLPVPSNLPISVALGYYALLALVTGAALRPWSSPQQQTGQSERRPPLLSKRAWRVLQCGAALIIVLATGTTVVAARSTGGGQLTITLLNVAPASQQPQGEAILIHTPDGKTALIDGGLDAAALATELDSRLPFWQHSLDLVMLTSPRQDALVGLYVRYNQSVRPGAGPERRIAA